MIQSRRVGCCVSLPSVLPPPRHPRDRLLRHLRLLLCWGLRSLSKVCACLDQIDLQTMSVSRKLMRDLILTENVLAKIHISVLQRIEGSGVELAGDGDGLTFASECSHPLWGGPRS